MPRLAIKCTGKFALPFISVGLFIPIEQLSSRARGFVPPPPPPAAVFCFGILFKQGRRLIACDELEAGTTAAVRAKYIFV